MSELQSIIVFHDRHFVRDHGIFNPICVKRDHGICNPICVKLLQIMSGVIPRNVKKRRLYLKPEVHKRGIHTDTHTHTHTR